MSFINERIPFFMDGQKIIVCGDSNIECEQWMHSEFGMNHTQWADSIRGYFMEGRIQFFTAEDYCSCDVSLLPCDLEDILYEYYVFFSEPPKIFNGVIPGELGESWEPIDCISE